MSDDNSQMPPIDPGPFLPVWPGRPMPRLSRPAIQTPPYPGGGGISVPPTAPQTYSLQGVATFQGTRLFTVQTASQKVLDAPASYRNMLMMRNSSAPGGANIFIEFGTDATLGSVIRLAPNEIILFDAVVPQDDIYVIGDAVGGLSVLVSVISLPT